MPQNKQTLLCVLELLERGLCLVRVESDEGYQSVTWRIEEIRIVPALVLVMMRESLVTYNQPQSLESSLHCYSLSSAGKARISDLRSRINLRKQKYLDKIAERILSGEEVAKEEFDLHSSCVGKEYFETRAKAREFAKKISKKLGEKIHDYKCRFCAYHHVGHYSDYDNRVVLAKVTQRRECQDAAKAISTE